MMNACNAEKDIQRISVDEMVRQAREIDPDCSRAAVERYAQEIAEMANVLESLPPGDRISEPAFKASWHDRND